MVYGLFSIRMTGFHETLLLESRLLLPSPYDQSTLLMADVDKQNILLVEPHRRFQSLHQKRHKDRTGLSFPEYHRL